MEVISDRDKELVDVKCSMCEIPIIIKFGTYRKGKDKSFYCKSCNTTIKKAKFDALPEKEKLDYIKRKNEAIRLGWSKQSTEKKKEISEIKRSLWANDERMKNHINMLKARWDNLTDDQKNKQIELMNIGKEKYWSNSENKEYHSNMAREKWYNQSEEDQIRIVTALLAGGKKFRDALTDKDRIELSKKQSSGLLKYWASLSSEEYESRIKIFQERLKHYFDNLDLLPNQNEIAFINYISTNNIQYEYVWYNKTKHPEFDIRFPFNFVRPGMKISPYHAWDFKLMLNDGIVLVDVDGSIHDPGNTSNMVTDYKGNKFILSNYIQFKDSQRPYQTDGLDAYVIQCYDDNISNDTPVLNLVNNETMSIKSFISIMTWRNSTKEEKKKGIKLI